MGQDEEESTATLTVRQEAPRPDPAARLVLEVVSGPLRGRRLTSATPTLVIGTHPSVELSLADPAVSRRHARLTALANTILLTDLGSKNGTLVAGVPVREALLDDGDEITVGHSVLRVARLAESAREAPLPFGGFLTLHPPLKAALERLRRAAASEATVLIEGETGTGKEVLAQGLHKESPRARGPFVVVDCGGVTPGLIESQLFGHRKGALTGAVADHAGAFESARGGTVFLDELGELPLELQPKLLRALEARTVRPLGSTEELPVDVRIVAATNKKLEEQVKEGRFRADLFYRVAVVRVTVPPLRQRPEDVPLLIHALARTLAPDLKVAPEVYTLLSEYDWPGNVRELRNVMQRAVAMSDGRVLRAADVLPDAEPQAASFHEAKEAVLLAFERRYVAALLDRAEGNVSRAAKEAGLSRNALYALMKRVGFPAASEAP